MLTQKQEQDRTYYLANRDRLQNKQRLYSKTTRYGITQEQWHKMWLEQEGLCKLCKRELDCTPDVDHDHNCCPTQKKSCGKCIRGLLHPYCNRLVVGGVEKIGLDKVIAYLGGDHVNF